MSSFEPDVSQWDPWRPAQVAARLADVDVPWYVAGGWAIDLFLGAESREHGDIEIGVPEGRFEEVIGAFAGLEHFSVGSGLAMPLTEGRLPDSHQTWIREPDTGKWRLDVFQEPSDGDTWICRRDPEIRLPYAQVIAWTEDGIPYGTPEIVLLFKAKYPELAKNQADFAAALPRLDTVRREWLGSALARVHPGHAWLRELAAVAA